MPPDRDASVPPGFVVGPRKEIAGEIRLTRAATLSRESSFAMSAQIPKDGKISPMGFTVSGLSEIDLRPGQKIAGKMKQTGIDIHSSEARLDRDEQAAFKAVAFTSTIEWDPQCVTPNFRNFESSDKTAAAKDMQSIERIMTVLDAEILACFQNGARVGNIAYLPAREMLRSEFLGVSTENVEGSVRVRVEGIGTFDGREAIVVALAGSPAIKVASTPLSGRYDGHIVFDAQTGIILSLEIAMAMRGVAPDGREIRYVSNRMVRVREMR